MQDVSASKATIARMPAYLRYLRAERERGEKYISSALIAERMEVSAILVRKDFALVSTKPGKPRLGFSLDVLISDIEKFLGYDNKISAVVVGAGGLGRAFMGYNGFQNYGMNIVSAFDVDENLIGKQIHGKTVYPVSEMETYIRKNKVRIGILTVPKSAAEEVCRVMVEAGIEAIWNFAPVALTVPKGVELKNEDLASSLALLSSRLVSVSKREK